MSDEEGVSGTRWDVGVDVGGTFTDLAAIGADGRVRTAKVLSVPADQSSGVVDALAAFGADASTVRRIVHGTTVVTNLLLERTGARVVLCATDGHVDVLHLRRQNRAQLYDLTAHHPEPLADETIAVPERVEPQGVVRVLTDAAADGVAERVAAREPESVAIALLHAYRDDGHERLLEAALRRRLPNAVIVRSSAVLGEIREYERTATTVAEAYARPRVATYLANLSQRLAAGGFPSPTVMTSSGGVRDADDAARNAASLALSGPAGGIAGASAFLRALGTERFPLALTIDIGGTSADVGLIVDGEPLVEGGGDVAGAVIALPRVLVETVSAGGGSLGWVDDAGALRVGPRSAGAVPGPAAFGRGGTEPTVTDAHVVLGHIAQRGFEGGVRIDTAAAERAVASLATRLGRSGVEGIHRVARAMLAGADAAMARALRRVSVERGVDPRQCVLVAFGGGGPLHACALADQLGVSRVLVPPHAGVLSAVGLALAPPRREVVGSVMRRVSDLRPGDVTTIVRQIASGIASDGAEARSWARMRYVGQGHELEVPLHGNDDGAALGDRFAALHGARVGFTLSSDVEVVSVRHTSSQSGPSVAFGRARRSGAVPDGGDRVLVDDGATLDARVVGPATVVLADATLRIDGGWTGRSLPEGGWLVDRA